MTPIPPLFHLPLPLSISHSQHSKKPHLNPPPRPLLRQTPTSKRTAPPPNSSPSASISNLTSSQIFSEVKSLIPLSAAFSALDPPPTLISTGHSSYKLCCPFHADSTPSLHFSDEKQLFHCFGCNAGGTIIDFELLRTGDDSLFNALRSLSARFPQIAPLVGRGAKAVKTVQNEIPVEKPMEKIVNWREQVKRKRVTNRLLKDLNKAYEDNFWGPQGEVVRDYMMEKRHFSKETLRTFGVGFAPEGFDFAVKGLGRLGYSEEDVLGAGLARKSEKGFVYDLLRERVVMPIREAGGAIVGMAGRVFIENGEGGRRRVPKYVNSSDSVLFKKGDFLFGEDVARLGKGGDGDAGFVLVVEGYMDVMSVFEHTNGDVACVATMGTAMTPKQLDKARKLVKDPIDGKVIINFDADDAGITAAERLCDSVIPASKSAHFVNIAVLPPDMKDPDEFLSQQGSAEEYISYVREVAIPWYEWRGKRYVIEELAIRDMEEDGIPSEEIARRLQGSDLYENRKMVEIRPGEGDDGLEAIEEIKVLNEELLVAFGAPARILTKAREDRARNKVLVSKNVIEKLAKIVECAQRSMPGLNHGALVTSWVDPLTDSRMPLMSSLYVRIMKRAEKLSEPWKNLAPVMQLKWLPPPPWVELERAKNKPWKKSRTRLRDVQNIWKPKTTKQVLDFYAQPNQETRSMAILEAQEKYVMPFLKANTCKEALMMKQGPRRTAEEMVLRALVFASEVDRVLALEKLLEVMVHCQERELPFWTSEGREKLFEYVTDVEGPMTAEDMAAELELKDWWSAELERLFVPVEEVEDRNWQQFREIEVSNPVEVVETVADGIAGMASKVAMRMAVEETESLLEGMLRGGEDGDVEGMMAKDVWLQSALDETKYLRPTEREERERILKEEEEEEKDEQELKKYMELVRQGEVPYPEHFLKMIEMDRD